MALTLVLVGAAGIAALALFLVTIQRPVFGCAALVFSVPLTAGLARGSIIPALKPSETILLVVLAGVIANRVTSRRERGVSGLDIAVVAYVIGSVVIPWMLLFLTRFPATLDTWRTVVSPALFLAVYYVFSRTELTECNLRLILNAALAAGVLVGLIAAAELANLPGVRNFFTDFYTGPVETPFRPSSTLGHYSAVGGLGLLTYIVALSLAAARKRDFPSWWLVTAMGAGIVGLVASETWATIAAVPVATLIVLVHARRIPKQLVVTVILGVLVMAALWPVVWPVINPRIDAQDVITAQGLAMPETMQTRINYWNEFILPALSDHLWIGTGTVIPSTVPDNLTTFVDNEYLWAGFRAGIPGIALLLGMLFVVIGVGWRQRRSPDPSRRALGAIAVAVSVSLLILGATAQYITFAGLSQEIAMLIGVLSVLSATYVTRRAAVVALRSRNETTWIAIPRTLEAAVVELRQLTPDRSLIRSSSVVFAGFATARALGFLFSVAAARILNPLDYGRMTYAIAVATVTSTFIASSPLGLSRFLSRNHADRRIQESYFVNWLILTGVIVVVSGALMTPIGFLVGLSSGLVVGVMCNFFGIAVLESYREVQRGLDRYSAMMSVYVVANLLQLLAILALGVARIHSAAIFLVVYGLSSVVALALIQPIAPIALKFARADLDMSRIKEIFRFIRPVLAQSVFFAVWFGSDIIMVQHFMSPRATGNYAVAKALVNVLILAPTAIGTTILPRVARVGERLVARYVVTALALTASATIPAVAAAVFLGPRLVLLVFGAKYALAAQPLAVLALGMGIYGIYTVFGSIWVGLGRPIVDSVATGVAMITTVLTGFAFIPGGGLLGAAIAFSLGAAIRVLVIAAYTLWMLSVWRAKHLGSSALETQAVQGGSRVLG